MGARLAGEGFFGSGQCVSGLSLARGCGGGVERARGLGGVFLGLGGFLEGLGGLAGTLGELGGSALGLLLQGLGVA